MLMGSHNSMLISVSDHRPSLTFSREMIYLHSQVAGYVLNLTFQFIRRDPPLDFYSCGINSRNGYFYYLS